MQILQITDPHLYGSASGRLRGVETDSSLNAVLDDAFARVPDYSAVLVTGDLVQDDTSGYLRFRSIFGNLQKPVLCIPGNHDEPEAMRRELNGAPFQICGTHEADGWQFIMLDSYDPGHVGGRLTQNELARLDDALHRSPQARHGVPASSPHHHGQPLVGHRGSRRARGLLARSSIRTPTSVPWCGDMYTRRTTADAAMSVCSRPRRPARNSCRRATAMRSTRGRPPTASSNCTPMDASTPRSTGSSPCRCARPRHVRPLPSRT